MARRGQDRRQPLMPRARRLEASGCSPSLSSCGGRCLTSVLGLFWRVQRSVGLLFRCSYGGYANAFNASNILVERRASHKSGGATCLLPSGQLRRMTIQTITAVRRATNLRLSGPGRRAGNSIQLKLAAGRRPASTSARLATCMASTARAAKSPNQSHGRKTNCGKGRL